MIAALITALCVIAAGATVWLRGWLARRDAARDVEAKVEALKQAEAAGVAKADEKLATERAKDPIDVVNERFGSKP